MQAKLILNNDERQTLSIPVLITINGAAPYFPVEVRGAYGGEYRVKVGQFSDYFKNLDLSVTADGRLQLDFNNKGKPEQSTLDIWDLFAYRGAEVIGS